MRHTRIVVLSPSRSFFSHYHPSKMESVDNFTNDSAMMIAWERHLESQRDDALFKDPFAKALAGTKGQGLSANFGKMCTTFEFPGWEDFHRSWVFDPTLPPPPSCGPTFPLPDSSPLPSSNQGCCPHTLYRRQNQGVHCVLQIISIHQPWCWHGHATLSNGVLQGFYILLNRCGYGSG